MNQIEEILSLLKLIGFTTKKEIMLGKELEYNSIHVNGYYIFRIIEEMEAYLLFRVASNCNKYLIFRSSIGDKKSKKSDMEILNKIFNAEIKRNNRDNILKNIVE